MFTPIAFKTMFDFTALARTSAQRSRARADASGVFLTSDPAAVTGSFPFPPRDARRRWFRPDATLAVRHVTLSVALARVTVAQEPAAARALEVRRHVVADEAEALLGRERREAAAHF